MKQKKTALISGITGQDGSYMADLLLSKGYHVVGLTRQIQPKFTKNIEHLKESIDLRYCSFSLHAVAATIEEVRPNEIYNFAGQTYVSKSWEILEETLQASGLIPSYFLDAILKIDTSIKFFQASSSEVLKHNYTGEVLDHNTPIEPSNPYGCAKALAYNLVKAYRFQHNIFAVNGIFFNHESPRRSENFISRKIIDAVINIKHGQQKELVLGNMDIVRDWGYAPDYVEAAYMMLQHQEAEDYLICTGEGHSIKEMVVIAFQTLGLDWQQYVKSSSKFFRAKEAMRIVGGNEKIKEILGWKPTVSFEEMIRLMIEDKLK